MIISIDAEKTFDKMFLEPIRLLHSWDFPGKNTEVGCHFFLQEIFPTQGLNPGLPHCRQTLYHLSHQGSPKFLKMYLIIYLATSGLSFGM